MLKLLLSAGGPRPTVLAIAIAAGLVTQSLSAQAQRGTIPLLITENSASDFTATYNGSPLSPSFEGQEQASFPLPAGTLLHDISELNGGPFGGNVGFTEPDNPGLFNWITTGGDIANGGPGVFIHSDESVAFFASTQVKATSGHRWRRTLAE